MIWPTMKRTPHKLKRPRKEPQPSLKLWKRKRENLAPNFPLPRLLQVTLPELGASGPFPPRPAGNYFRPQGRHSGNSFRGFDLSSRCGKRGHWASSCSSKQNILIVRIKIMSFWIWISVNLISRSRESKNQLVFKGSCAQVSLLA